MRRIILLSAVLCPLVVSGCTLLRDDHRLRILARSPFTTEQQWIVASVAGSIDGLAAAVHDRPAEIRLPSVQMMDENGQPSEREFRVKPIGAPPTQVVVREHIWSPGTYAPLAAAWLGPETHADPRPVDPDVRSALVDLRTSVLLDEDERVSALLGAHPRSAAAHESAALLIAAMALRETTSIFGDIRPALSRGTAHMAVAQVLRGNDARSRDGELANIVLTALSGRHRDAINQLAAFERGSTSPTDRVWSRALRLRITGDWREGAPLSDEALLVRLEFARAVRGRLGAERFLDYLDTLDHTDEPDWHRLAMNNTYPRPLAKRFVTEDMRQELDEITLVRARVDDQPGRTIAQALMDTTRPSHVEQRDEAPVVTVLDWTMWAPFLQRHLCQTIVGHALHLNWANDKTAHASFVETMKGTYGDLTVFPIALMWIKKDRDFNHAIDDIVEVADAQPERLTAGEWNYIIKARWSARRGNALPSDVAWFTPAVPMGTGFDLENRSLAQSTSRPPTIEQSAFWAHQQPYADWTIWSNEWLPVKTAPDTAHVRKAFGDLLAYDTNSMINMMDYLPISPEEMGQYARRLCAVAPERCDRAGDALLLIGDEAEALKARETYVARSRNRVDVSIDVAWLVRHYVAHNQMTRAESLAREAAGNRNVPGLAILGEVLESKGDLQGAEAAFRAAADAGRDGKPLLGGFLLRRVPKGAKAPREARVLVEEIRGPLGIRLTRGLVRLTAASIASVPTEGVAFYLFGARAEEAGLRPSDIIIGVDEWRVRSRSEFDLAMRLRLDDDVRFTVWRNNRFFQIDAEVPERTLASNMADLTERPGPARRVVPSE